MQNFSVHSRIKLKVPVAHVKRNFKKGSEGEILEISYDGKDALVLIQDCNGNGIAVIDVALRDLELAT